MEPCSPAPHRPLPWTLTGPALAGHDSSSARCDQVPSSSNTQMGLCPGIPVSPPGRPVCRVPSPLAEDSKAQMIFVCDDAFQHVSKSHVSLRLFIPFRGSGSEPGSPRLGQLTHPDGVFGWRLPSDPGSLHWHMECASIWPRESSTLTAIL